MRTSKLTYALLLALLLQASFGQEFPASEPVGADQYQADSSTIKNFETNFETKGPKDPKAVSAAKQIKDGFLDVEKGSCKAKGGDKCKPEVPALGIKGSPQIAEQLKEYWQTRSKETLDDTKAQKKRFLAMAAEDDLNSRNLRGEAAQTKDNLRSLYSVGNKYSDIDEGNILAWQNNYLYISMGQKNLFKIVKVTGPKLSVVQTLTISPDLKAIQVLVNGEFFAIIFSGQTLTPQSQVIPEVTIKLYRYVVSTNSLAFIKQFRREGLFVQAREVQGYLHVLTQYSEVTDLSWSVSGTGNVGANVNYCSSWDGLGRYIRNIAAISLSLNPTYTFDAYLGCDQTTRAMLAPSGNWYIASAKPTNNFYSTIIQKVHRTQPNSSQWAGLPDIKLHAVGNDNDGWDEYGNCTLRVAGQSADKRLNLFAFDCTGFNQVATTGLVGQSGGLSAFIWIERKGYAAFSYWNGTQTVGQILVYEQGNSTIQSNGRIGWIQPEVLRLRRFGPNHMLSISQRGGYTIALLDVEYKKSQITYKIIPNKGTFVNSNLFASEQQAMDVDFENKRVVFPITSDNAEPYKNGFYYLHIEVDPIPCMTVPPISQCSVNGTASVQTHNLQSKMYKHWDEVGKPWGTTPSESALRSVTLTSGLKKYLYTLSNCQLQAREDPINSQLFTPVSSIDLCV